VDDEPAVVRAGMQRLLKRVQHQRRLTMRRVRADPAGGRPGTRLREV
jgi:hypothetical protein